MPRKLLPLLTLVFFCSIDAHAAWQWQSTGAITTDIDPRSCCGGIVVPNPAGLTVGDDVFLVVGYRIGAGAGSTWPAPSGWTSLASSTDLAAFCRKADSFLVAAGSQQINGPVAGNSIGFMLRFTGGATGCIPHASTVKNNASSAQDIATNALSISQPDTLVLEIGLFNWLGAEAGINSYPGGATNLVNFGSSFATNQFSIVAGSLIQTTATSITAGTIDLVSSNSAYSKSILVSLPAAVPTAAPTGVAVDPTGTSAPTTTLRVSWTVAANAHHYRVRYKRTVDSTYVLLPAQFTSTTMDITGLTAGTTYDVQVASANSSESVLIWPGSATQGTTQLPSATAIKFNPGHYVWFTPTLYGNENLAADVNTLNAFINSTVCPDAAWQGVMVYAFWSALEGDTQGNYSGTRSYAGTTVSIGFNWVDSVLSTLELCGKRLQLALVDYSGPGASPYSWAWPAYIYDGSLTSQVVGTRTDYRKGCLAYTNNSSGWSGGIGQTIALWETACMDHLIALSNAYGDRYNNNSHFEMFEPFTNMSYASNIFTFSNSAFATETIRLINAIRPHWPNTALHVWMDYFSTDTIHLSVLQAGIDQDFVFGGNDVLPDEDIQADRLFNGETTGIDYRGVVPWAATVAGPELCGHEGTFTPYQLFNHAFDGNPSIGNGIRGMYPQYYRWLRNTWDCAAGGPQRFDTGISGNYTSTSTSSVSIGTGSKSFSTQTGLAFAASDYVVIANDANNYMEATITSYNSGTGSLVVNVLKGTGSGTKASWNIRKEGMTTFIRSINGAIGNGTDGTRRSPASVKSIYCPTGYAGGCY